MKKLMVIALLAATASALAEPQQNEAPAAVLRKYYNAIHSDDVDTAYSLGVEKQNETKEDLKQ